MNQNLLNRLLNKSRTMLGLQTGKFAHFSFIVRKNNIMSIGINKCQKTHPLAVVYGYRFDRIHSELDAILNLDVELRPLIAKSKIVNIRLNKKGEALLSKPCSFCSVLLNVYKPRAVYYTDQEGNFQCL